MSESDNSRDAEKTPYLSRREFLQQGRRLVGGAGLMALLPTGLNAAVHAGGGDGLEKTDCAFGIIPLTDCAPLAVALEKGHFRKYGLNVTLSREPSWANVRDKVAVGALDGAQMLASMPIAATLGLGTPAKPMITAFSMDLNGNAITVSNSLYSRMMEADPEAMRERPLSARALKKVIDLSRNAGRPPMTFATVFPYSKHNYEIRYWMAAAGIDPDRDVRLIVVPPPQMVANLESRNIDGYCVGEPWNARAVMAGIGHTLITSYEIWSNSTEKVLGVSKEWAERHPNTHRAVLMALLEAAQWMDKPENRNEVARLISSPSYVDAPEEVVSMSMTGTFSYSPGSAPQPLPDFNVFHRYAANYPWRSHAVWFLTQMIRWGQITEPVEIQAVANAVYRPDLYRDAAARVGVAVPASDHKIEGAHSTSWSLDGASTSIAMGPDRFFDGRVFDPERPVDYLASFEIRDQALSLADLMRLNRTDSA